MTVQIVASPYTAEAAQPGEYADVMEYALGVYQVRLWDGSVRTFSPSEIVGAPQVA